MNEALTRQILLPAHETLRGRKTLEYYRELTEDSGSTASDVASLQLRKLRRLVAHSVRNVPWFRRLASERRMPAPETMTFEQFAELPVLGKEDIRGNLEAFRADGYEGRLMQYSTGGSTGDPLVFYTDVEKEARHKAHDWRCRSWFGVLPGDRQVDLWGSPIELEKLTSLRKWKDRYLLNHVVLPAFDLNRERLGQYVDFIRSFGPRLIYGYPSVLNVLAQFILDEGLELGRAAPRLVSCTSEMLYALQRDAIEEAFGCAVANEYGSRDGGLIAHECPHGAMHIAAEHVLVEVDEPDADGVGSLLVTNLDGFGMPLLRYEIGDLGAIDTEPCRCGRPLPVLRELRGRSNDFLVGARGARVHSLAPIYALRPYRRKIRQFKVLQRRDLSLEIHLCCIGAFEDAELDRIRSDMRQVLGLDEIRVEFVFAERIEVQPSGKHRAVFSEALPDAAQSP